MDKSKLEEKIKYLKDEMAKIRTGRASPALLEQVKVDAYDSQMSIKELGSITVSDAKTLVISVWNKDLIENVSKAISASDLGLNPTIDGGVIRVPVPSLTEERREEMTHLVTEKVEEIKNSIRNVRQEFIKEVEADFKNKEIGEDEKFRQIDIIEETIKEYTQEAVEIGDNKKEIIRKV